MVGGEFNMTIILKNIEEVGYVILKSKRSKVDLLIKCVVYKQKNIMKVYETGKDSDIKKTYFKDYCVLSAVIDAQGDSHYLDDIKVAVDEGNIQHISRSNIMNLGELYVVIANHKEYDIVKDTLPKEIVDMGKKEAMVNGI